MRLEQRRLDTVVTGQGLLPRLDLFVQLTKTGFGSSFGEAVSGLGEPTYEMGAGLRFEQLLGNEIAAAADRQAHLRREQAARAVENLESLVALDVSLALNEITRAHAQIDASRATAAAEARVFETERERLAVGESTALLVAHAERDLLAARVAEVEAQVAYRIALVRLYVAEGSLLERRAVELAADRE
jgi:outer membrane protein TolC